ncbi:MAG: helix-turn-helix domain-containing protein [bacterium]
MRRARQNPPRENWRKWLASQLRDPEFRAAYDRLAPQYEIARQLIALRRQRGLTQKVTANAAGMAPPELAKIERGKVLPGLTKLAQIYASSGYDLEVRPITRSGKPARGIRPIRIRGGVGRVRSALRTTST